MNLYLASPAHTDVVHAATNTQCTCTETGQEVITIEPWLYLNSFVPEAICTDTQIVRIAGYSLMYCTGWAIITGIMRY